MLPARDHAGAPPTYVVERRGSDVVVVEGFSPERTGVLVQGAFRATKTEINHPQAAQPKTEVN